jgi:hypothetical protein
MLCGKVLVTSGDDHSSILAVPEHVVQHDIKLTTAVSHIWSPEGA